MKEIESNKPPLVARGIHKEYDGSVILDDVSVSINPNNRIAIVGLNGSGKSTLLNILTGDLIPDNGVVDSNELRIGHLRQNEQLSPDMTLMEYMTLDIPELIDALDRFRDMSEHYEDSKAFETAYDQTLAYINRHDGFTLKDRLYRLMEGLGLDVPIEREIGNISGGEFVKAGLIRLLIQQPDILVLDEPTNHLDIFANLWLREFLDSWPGGVLITSHDRSFLNEVVDETIELENGNLTVYGGNYDFYIEQKGIMNDAQLREVVRLEKEVRKSRRKLQKEQQRAAHGDRKDISRDPDDNDRVRANYFKEKASRTAGRNRDSAISKIQSVQEKLEEARLETQRRINPSLREKDENYLGRRLITTDHLRCGYTYDNQIVAVEQFQVSSGDRIAIFGRNGSGKSTLINALVGNDANLHVEGDVRKNGELSIEIIDQRYSIVDRKLTVIENLQKFFDSASITDLRRHLAYFLFTDEEMINRRASSLSGGEIARLAMAIVTILPIDLLILDEPTNNLDIHSIEEVEDSLKTYSGGLIVISHDISFLQRVGINSSFLINQRRLIQMSNVPEDGVYFKEELLHRLKLGDNIS